MRGHIYTRSPGSWRIAVDSGRVPVTGKRRQFFETVRGTKRNAEKRLAELLHQLDTGSFVTPERITLTEYLAKWLADYGKPKLSPRSYDRYADIIKRYIDPVIGNVPLSKLEPSQIQGLYSAWLDKGLSARTVKYHHAVIHVALKSAVKWGLVGRNVADAVEVPKGRRKDMQTWNETEITQFLEITEDNPYYALFYTALFTGMRRSELLGLTWGNVDLLFGQIHVTRSLHQLKDSSFVFSQPKSAKGRRTIALTPSNILLLKSHREKQGAERLMIRTPLTDNDLVFGTIDGKPIRPNTITRAWSMLVAKSGLKPIRFHDCRHTHASLMLTQGIHPKIVQERLGHASIAMTLDTYSHVAPGLQEAAAQRFDDIFKGNLLPIRCQRV